MPKFTGKLTHKITNKSAPASLSEATIFSKRYEIVLAKSAGKVIIARLIESLIQDISKPLAYKGIIIGHIKILAKLSAEDFLFLSLTRLDSVDTKYSSQWQAGANGEFINIKIDINVLIFGYNDERVEEVVNAALTNLHCNIME